MCDFMAGINKLCARQTDPTNQLNNNEEHFAVNNFKHHFRTGDSLDIFP